MRNRTDNNQADIVRDLRTIGATVLDLSQVGFGCPDILVGFRRRNFLVEIKNPDTYGKLSDDQNEFHDAWRGEILLARASTHLIAELSRKTL